MKYKNYLNLHFNLHRSLYIYVVCCGFLLFHSISSVSAQDSGGNQESRPGIFFKSRSHDFGELKESMKFATHRFEFVNRTPRPIIVNKVESSCGCTAPSWSSEPIAPGATGFIDARYETTNRPGSFDKTLTVYTNSPHAPITYLSIKGNVIREVIPESSSYPVQKIGRLDFEKYQITFEPLLDNQTVMKEIRVINQSSYSTNLYLVAREKLPEYVQIKYPSSLEPGEVGRIQVSIDGAQAPGYGFGSFEAVIQSNAPGSITTSLQVNYNRVQYFPELTKRQLKRAQKLVITPNSVDFGSQASSGGFLEGNFTFKNEGKEPLKIKQINADCPCISFSSIPDVILPGKTATLPFRFDTVTKTGAKSIGIRIISNDPREPERYIWVKAQFPNKYEYKCPTCP